MHVTLSATADLTTCAQVGPIPITNESTYTSLNWATTKGEATIRNYNADEDLQTEFYVSLECHNLHLIY